MTWFNGSKSISRMLIKAHLLRCLPRPLLATYGPSTSQSGLSRRLASGHFLNILLAVLMIVLLTGLAEAASYRSVLKKWTRSAKDYSFEGLEMRLDWKATYFSDEFRQARRAKLQSDLQWTEDERQEEEAKDKGSSSRHDEFFIGIYAGSNVYPDIGKNSGQWRLAIDVGGKVVKAQAIEKVQVTDVDRKLYPYLNHWTNAYRVRFPKTIRPGEKFSLKMMGIPATSELKWD